MTASPDATVTCSCCGRTRRRGRVHRLGEDVFICRRCGLWVALRPGRDDLSEADGTEGSPSSLD